MAKRIPVQISGAVEGSLDEAVLTRLITLVGAVPGPIYGKEGKAYIKQKVRAYNEAARRAPWVVLVDLDQSCDCAPPLVADWLPDPAPFMCFRVAVREVETWLLADSERLAEFLGVSVSKFPSHPEALSAPKQTLINLARRSRRTTIREDIVPRTKSGRAVGVLYTSRLAEFATNLWRPRIAERNSESLHRCNQCLRSLVRSWQEQTASGTK